MGRHMRLAPILLPLLAPAAAQDPPVIAETAATESAPALHRGWLLELLDGNHRGAAELYEQAGADEALPAELRALALARLVELARLRPDPGDLNLVLRQFVDMLNQLGPDVRNQLPGLRTAQLTVPVNGLAAAASEGEGPLRDWMDSHRTRRGDLVDTRPLVPTLYDRLLGELARARVARDDPAAQRLLWELSQPSRRFPLRYRAITILNLVLEGQNEQADRLRRFLPRRLRSERPMPDNPAVALERARRRLDSELARMALKPEERRGLRLLQERIADDPTRDPDTQILEAIELLRNLPVYGELLLGERGR